MMFTFLSLINMTIFGSILIFIIYLLINNNKILLRFGTKLLCIGILLIVIRFFLPFELPFTRTIIITKYLPDIYAFLLQDLFFIGNRGISLQTIFYLIWGTGSIFLLIHSAYTYFKLKRIISGYTAVYDTVILQLADELFSAHHKRNHFHIVKTSQITTPMVFGLKETYIILPAIDLSKEEWRFILSHEITHFYQGHLYYKVICQILCNLYWWNPFVYLLKRLLNNLLEMTVDAEVTKVLPVSERLDYLQCLLKISRLEITSSRDVYAMFTFSNHNSTLIARRSHLILNHSGLNNAKLLLPFCIAVIAYLILLLCSIFFIVQPRAYKNEVLETSFSFNDSDCFLIENLNGTYDVYQNSQYVITINSSLSDVENVRIYSTLEEALSNEKN